MQRIARIEAALAATAEAAASTTPPPPAAAEATLMAALIETIATAEAIADRLRPGAAGRLNFLYTRMYDPHRPLLEARQRLAAAMARALAATPATAEAAPLWNAAWTVARMPGTPPPDAPQALARRAAQAMEEAVEAAKSLMRSFEDSEAAEFYATLKASFDTERAEGERYAIDEWVHSTPRRDRTPQLKQRKAAESFGALAATGFLDAMRPAVDIRRPEDEGDAYTIDGVTFSYHSGRRLLMRQGRPSDPAARTLGTLDTFALEAACRRLADAEGRPDPDRVARYVASQRATIAPEAVAEYFAHAERMERMARLMPRQAAKPANDPLFASAADRPAWGRRVARAVERLFGQSDTATTAPDGSRLTLTTYLVAACYALCADGVLLPSVNKKAWREFLNADCGLAAPRLASTRTFSTALSSAADGIPCKATIARLAAASPRWRALIGLARETMSYKL